MGKETSGSSAEVGVRKINSNGDVEVSRGFVSGGLVQKILFYIILVLILLGLWKLAGLFISVVHMIMMVSV